MKASSAKNLVENCPVRQPRQIFGARGKKKATYGRCECNVLTCLEGVCAVKVYFAPGLFEHRNCQLPKAIQSGGFLPRYTLDDRMPCAPRVSVRPRHVGVKPEVPARKSLNMQPVVENFRCLFSRFFVFFCNFFPEKKTTKSLPRNLPTLSIFLPVSVLSTWTSQFGILLDLLRGQTGQNKQVMCSSSRVQRRLGNPAHDKYQCKESAAAAAKVNRRHGTLALLALLVLGIDFSAVGKIGYTRRV